MRNPTTSPQQIKDICETYASCNQTTESLALKYNLSSRSIQRIVKKHGEIRTVAESNKKIAHLKDYSALRQMTYNLDSLVYRKTISSQLRSEVISLTPFCVLCGDRPENGAILTVNRIDNNLNNRLENLQVLCKICSCAKGIQKREERYKQNGIIRNTM